MAFPHVLQQQPGQQQQRGQQTLAWSGDLSYSNQGTMPQAGFFYPSDDMQGGTLCLAQGPSGEAALAAAMMPFTIEEKTASDVGLQPRSGFVVNAPAMAASNRYFRRVLYTLPDEQGQLVVMSLPPGESIGIEARPTTTQVISVQSGTGTARVGNQIYQVSPGAMIVVPPSTLCDVVNSHDQQQRHRPQPQECNLSITVFYTRALYAPGLVDPMRISQRLGQESEADQGPSDETHAFSHLPEAAKGFRRSQPSKPSQRINNLRPTTTSSMRPRSALTDQPFFKSNGNRYQ